MRQLRAAEMCLLGAGTYCQQQDGRTQQMFERQETEAWHTSEMTSKWKGTAHGMAAETGSKTSQASFYLRTGRGREMRRRSQVSRKNDANTARS